ncbi:MAG: glycine zipper family protein [Syntrophales bacterium]|nr:glycine zipper family protein [Syntrophales bacterium]
MRRSWQIWVLLFVFSLVQACATYEPTVVPFKLPSAYPNATEVAGAVVAAYAYTDAAETEKAFGFDMIAAGIIPVKVIFDNKGSHPLDIVAAQTFLADVEGNLWPVLDEKMAYDRIQKKTQFGKVAPEAAKYGGLAGIAGGVIGAAIGIVSGQNVGDAVMKGAAIGAATGITMGGTKGLSDRDVQERIRSDLEKRSLENRSVKPGELAHGFVFFPGESKKPVEMRLRLKEADTGKAYTLNMKL